MPSRSSGPDIQRLAEICRRHSMPLTAQRRIVLEELSRRSDHPTTDDIFDAVQKEMREISRTTVYRVLEAFVRIGVARKVCHPGAAARYESRMQRHHHLVCLSCDSIVDLDDPSLDQLPLPVVKSGFKVEDYSIQFRGLCPRCARSDRPVGRARKPRAGSPPDERPSRGPLD